MYSLGNSWAGRKCPISGGAKRCQTARESIPPQNPGSGGQGFGVGIDSCPASEETRPRVRDHGDEASFFCPFSHTFYILNIAK